MRLTRLEIKGFRSIRDTGQGIELGGANVMIGANGAGKSNLVAFFGLLRSLYDGEGGTWVARHGGAAANLYYGPKLTPSLSAGMVFSDGDGPALGCRFVLNYAAPDTLQPAVDRIDQVREVGGPIAFAELRFGDRAPDLNSSGQGRCGVGAALLETIGSIASFHFQDTSLEARVMREWDLVDHDHLKADGYNVASVLYRLKQQSFAHYDRIVSVVRSVAPWFGDFVLEPNRLNPQRILLRWREPGADVVFGPHQLSDGTLRFILIATLLLLPRDELPNVVLIDEPEIGLHPVALDALVGMVRGVADDCQVILTTQSTALLDRFDPAEVIVVDRAREGSTNRYESVFRRLDENELADWLEDYALGEAWEKGVLGGRPAA